MNLNPNCDGGHCIQATGQVRVLPTGGSGINSSNLILCYSCFNHEIAYRRERNLDLSKESAFQLPAWADLKVYPENLTEGA